MRTQLAHPLLARLAAEEARLRGDAGASGPSGAPAGRPPDLPAARLAALADEAFRAGAATLARGDAAAAVALLDLAARAVPAGHPRAAARIAALLASARAGAAAGAAAPDAHAERAAPGEAPAELPKPAREETSGPGQDRDAEVAAAAAGAADALRDAAGQGGHAAAQAADPRERSAAGPAADGGATQPGGAGAAEGRGRTAAGAEPAQAPAAGQAGADRSVGTSAGEATEGAAQAPGGAPSAEPAAGLTESGGSTTAPTALGSRASGAKSPAVATADTPAEPPAGALARDAGAADAHFGAAVDALQRCDTPCLAAADSSPACCPSSPDVPVLAHGTCDRAQQGPLTDCCLQLTSCTPQARVRRGRAAPGGRARCVPLGPAGGAGEDQKVPRGGWRQAAAVAAAAVGRRSGCPCVLEGGMLSCA